MWTLVQYQSAYDELYKQCDKRLRAAIDQRLTRLAMLGNMAHAPVSKPLGDRLFECRATAGNRHVRFLYFFRPGKVIVIAVAIFKDQRKTPRSAIDRAKRIRDTLLAEPELMNELTTIH